MPWLVVAARKGVSFFDATCSLVQRRWGDNMVEILKFSRETVFTPETIQILAAALDEAWERLRQSGSRLTRPAYSRAMREVVAKRIMEMARRGVEDREAAFECFKCRSGYRGSWHPTKMNAGRNLSGEPLVLLGF